MLWLLPVMLGGACKERGTITIDLANDSCGGTHVRFQAVKNGTCSCTCGTCSCQTTTTEECVRDVPCTGTGCTLDEARANGLEFSPPSAGQYALTYQFLDDSVPAKTLSIACVIVDVDADGTASSTSTPTMPACCP